MSNIIGFLESIGRTRLSEAQYAAAVATLDIDAAQRDALLRRDAGALNDLLGGRATQMMMMLFPVEEPRKQDDEPADDDRKDRDEPSESIRRH
ncbi:hypothetical protein [Chiayiivirga flava]|uniref:Uncharacterized protein n=1 Tax=Chiayiivirga flava TaxID=659595 RepID=A0A7W8D5T9_9GAMM|nr:hypothetical protein [Chiayiivirga flava]MBB5208451.1 hypothetical protein [Chiayiivirga flava]